MRVAGIGATAGSTAFWRRDEGGDEAAVFPEINPPPMEVHSRAKRPHRLRVRKAV
jgi:hypothetical protein